MADVKVGDELLLVDRYIENGKTQRGSKPVRVHKVGRTLIHIARFEGHPEHGTLTYRIETGRPNGDYSTSDLWKPEDWAAEQQRGGLEDVLRLHGIDVRGHKPIAVLEALFDVMERAERGEIT